MNMLHLLKVDGTVETEDYQGPLVYACPPWDWIKDRLGLRAHENLEHVSVLWQDRYCHMFVDEEGLMHGLKRNDRATRIYYNATVCRQQKGTNFVYSDLSVDPRQQTVDETPGFMIVGPALLWEGDME